METEIDYFDIDTFMVRNDVVLAIIGKFLPDASVSVGTVCRKLPYLLMELSHETSSVWSASCTLENDSIIFSCYGDLVSNEDFPICSFKLIRKLKPEEKPAVVKTVRQIAKHPIKKVAINKCNHTEPFVVLSNFGKGVFTVSIRNEDETHIFYYGYRKLPISFGEFLWITGTRLRNLFSSTKNVVSVKYCHTLSPEPLIANITRIQTK